MDNVIACILTIILEAFVILKYRFKLTDKIFKLTLITSVPLNIITNLALNSILENAYSLNLWFYFILVLLLEILVVVIEAISYCFVTKNKQYAWKISFHANAKSFIIGSLIFNLFF